MKKFLSKYGFFLGVVVAVVVIIAFPLIFKPMIIQTGSMVVNDGPNKPGLPPGTVVFVLKTDAPLKPTDIISYQQADMSHPVTHTFIGYADDGSLMTKGDANPVPDVRDVPLQRSDVIGKVVFSLPFLTQFYWGSVRGVVTLAILFTMVIAGIIVIVRTRKEPRKDIQQKETSALHPV